MTDLDLDKEREAFEAWADSAGYSAKRTQDGHYFFPDTAGAWEAWQARATLAGETGGVVVEDALASVEWLAHNAKGISLTDWGLHSARIISALQFRQSGEMCPDITPSTAALVDGVMDLFPSADKQALQCLAELMNKAHTERRILSALATPPAAPAGPAPGDFGPLSVRIVEAILLHLGKGASPSREPGADPRRDRLCALIEPLLAAPAPEGKEPERGLAEAIARVISESYGEDPDEEAPLTKVSGPRNERLPNWMAYQEQGEAVAYAFLTIDRAPEGKEPLRAFLRYLDTQNTYPLPLAWREEIRRLCTKDGGDLGRTYRIEHDGFEGDVIGHYRTKEGKEGVVLQQAGTRVVHVYGRKWLKEVGDE